MEPGVLRAPPERNSPLNSIKSRMLKRDDTTNLGERLRQIIAFIPGIRVSGYVASRGTDLYRLTEEMALEGIIARRKASTYQAGRRSPDWLNIR